MRLQLGNRVFAPRPVGILLTLVLLAVCVALGNWQLGRSREKQALLAAFGAGAQSTVDLTGIDVDGLARYQHVAIRGHYAPQRQILIDNMSSSIGVAGYRVLTPFVRDDGRELLLVDRGWVPFGASRAVLPDVSVDADDRGVRGRLDRLPIPGVRVGAAAAPGDLRWPRVLLFPRPEDVERVLGEPVATRIVLLDADLPDGYERVWRPSIGFGPARHLGYALQWFALALTGAVAFVAMSLRRSHDPPAST